MTENNFKQINIGVGFFLDQNIRLCDLFEFVPCLPIFLSSKKFKKTKETPYTGDENSIIGISINFKDYKKRRGIQDKFGLNSMCSVYFQNNEKTIYLTISSKYIGIVGTPNKETAFETINNFILLIKQTRNHWDNIFKMPYNERNELIEWLKHNITDENNLLMFDNHLFVDRLLNDFEDKPEKMVSLLLLSSFTYDYPTIKKYFDWLKRSLSSTKSIIYDEDDLKISRYQINLGGFENKINKNDLSLSRTSIIFKNKNYNISYNNITSPKDFKIVIPIDEKDEEEIMKDGFDIKPFKKIKAHRFRIFRTGKIELNSPVTFSVAKRRMEEIISIINDCDVSPK